MEKGTLYFVFRRNCFLLVQKIPITGGEFNLPPVAGIPNESMLVMDSFGRILHIFNDFLPGWTLEEIAADGVREVCKLLKK